MSDSDEEIERLKAEIEKLRAELQETKKELEDTTYYYTNITPYIRPLIEPWEPTEEELELLYNDPIAFIKKVIKEHKLAVYAWLFLLSYLGYWFIRLLLMYYFHIP